MQYAFSLAWLVLVNANPSFHANELTYVLRQSGAVGLFLATEFHSNPAGAIACKAAQGNNRLREMVDLKDEIALFSRSARPAHLSDVKLCDAV